MSDLRDVYSSAWRDLGQVVARSDSWDHISGCAEWTARQLAGHLVDGFSQVCSMIVGAEIPQPTTDPGALSALARDDPETAVRQLVESVDPVLRRLPQDGTVRTPRGELASEEFLATTLIEPVIHAWDLGRAFNVDVILRPEAVALLLPGVRALGEQLAASGMFAPATPARPNASPQEQLLAAAGRS